MPQQNQIYPSEVITRQTTGGESNFENDNHDVANEEVPSTGKDAVTAVREKVLSFYNERKTIITYVLSTILVVLYAVYFACAMQYDIHSEDAVRLVWVTCLLVLYVITSICITLYGPSVSHHMQQIWLRMAGHHSTISWCLVALIYVFIVIFVIIDVAYISQQLYNIVSLSGLICYVLLFYLLSYDYSKVNWKPVIWGIGLQFILAFGVLRWQFGYQAFRWLGERITEFLSHTNQASIYLAGPRLAHTFVFALMPRVVFFSTIISVLYYMQIMQTIIEKLSRIMQVTMETTAGESLTAAANIFIGQSESPLIIRPLIKDMTKSELHAVLASGFATITGSIFAVYSSFGVPPQHMLSASVMSAPAALAMAKLLYPEVERSKMTSKKVIMEATKDRSLLEAACSGASVSILLVANILVNLVAFISMLYFINATFFWIGARIGMEHLSVELIVSYIFWPFALFMGVEVNQCRKVAELVGVKTILNEFVAYTQLSQLIRNKVRLSDHERSEVISTYALCGFANFGSIGVMIGALSSMAPNRKSDIASVAFRAMVAGNVACFMTACIAGLLYQSNEKTLL